MFGHTLPVWAHVGVSESEIPGCPWDTVLQHSDRSLLCCVDFQQPPLMRRIKGVCKSPHGGRERAALHGQQQGFNLKGVAEPESAGFKLWKVCAHPARAVVLDPDRGARQQLVGDGELSRLDDTKPASKPIHTT